MNPPIRNGDVLAFEAKGFWSAMIRLRTLSEVSHVGFAFWLHDQLWVIEARERIGVRLWPLRSYLQRPGYKVHHYELQSDSGISREDVVAEALKSAGQAYASPFQFLRSWGRITKWLCDRWGIAPDTDESRWHCSEFVTRKLIDAGLDKNGYEPPQMSPGDVTRMTCLRHRGEVQLCDI